MRIGIDTGGTFTDFTVLDGKTWRVHKVPSDPDSPARAILHGLRDLGIDLQQVFHLVHGTTVATNAVLERKGARCAYVTNRGFADILSLGRQARSELYNLTPSLEEPPVPADLCLETGGRLAFDGEELEPLTETDLDELCRKIEALKPEAVAINLLFSFLDDRHERQIEEALPEGLFVSRSSEVLPEIREYERGMATWLNSYVGPRVGRYIDELHQSLPKARLDTMQSHGATLPGQLAARHAVRLLLSGPAGGLAAALQIGRQAGCERILSLDMGGTSTDVALIDGDIRMTSKGEIGGWPISVPMADMHTIGAGGGSLAYRDSGHLLRVGPRSAGSRPGPACYARGGTEPTVTDANVVLGWLPVQTHLAGDLPLDDEAAKSAVSQLARELELDSYETAQGIVHLVNENMAQALRVVSVRQGHNPKDFVLMAFGG
ncbi:MAG: hydantoinase/oxoprolinase family protein, partial [Gammaproteobacteria bacterium]|nr:hydantoinase/oxoprolinase family protein [Gammaproteobacteria bacterium]